AKYTYYRCHTKICPTTGIREQDVNAVISEHLLRLEFDESERQELAVRIEGLKKHWIEERDSQVTRINMRLQALAERLQRLTDAYLDQTIERTLFEERKVSLLFERKELEETLQRLKGDTGSFANQLTKFLEIAGSAYLLYKTANLDKKRQ